MLQQLLNCPKHPEHKNYQFLPVSTSYEAELVTVSSKILENHRKKQKQIIASQQFMANQVTENIKDELVLLKLKGYINPKDITGKSTEIKKLPSKVQVGTVIEGDPIIATKIRNKKKESSFADYFLKLDKQAQFTTKKFTQLQKLNQRKKRLKRKIIAKKQKASNK